MPIADDPVPQKRSDGASRRETEHIALRARQRLAGVFSAPEHAFTIHYALQQLRRGQREIALPVAAIALRNVGTGSGTVFSIKAEADAAGVDLTHADAEMLLRLEYSLLFKFNDFLSDALTSPSGCRLVHWYMRDDKFGFPALEHRFRKVLADLNQILHGARSASTASPFQFGSSRFPVRVPDEAKVDLAGIVRDLYGVDRIGLMQIAERNRLSHAEAIAGEDEPEAFESGNHARLQWSTSSKARLIEEVARLAARDALVLQRPQQAARAAAGRIFINYRREDTEAAAGRLHDKLVQSFGDSNVFFDTDDLPVGIDFAQELLRQLAACDVFVAVIGRTWTAVHDAEGRPRLWHPDDFVRGEIRAALSRGIPVIPVLVDGAGLPRADDLPEDIRPMLRMQAYELRHGYFPSDSEHFIARIRETIGHLAARNAQYPLNSVGR